MIEALKSDPLNSPGSREQDNPPANVEAILQSILGGRSGHFGLAAAVLRGRRIIAHGAAGLRKRGAAQRITIEDKFLLGSSTKAMTATIVTMLVEEAKL